MKIRYNIILLGLFFSFCGCVEDDTVDDFKELNAVTIEGLEEKYSVLLYDTLNIPLELKTAHGDESHLSYIWYVYTSTSMNKADTLSKERNLNIMLEPSFVNPGEDYTLVIKVTDESTGVYYRNTMKLEVLSQFTKGTVLLCKENENTEVNFLTLGAERELIENVYSKANGGKTIGKNPIRIYSIDASNSYPELKKELIFCRDENGGVLTSPISFALEKTIKGAFLNDFGSDVLNPEIYFKGSMIDYIIINGKVCKRSTNMGSSEWEAPLVSLQGSGNYELAPFVMGVNSFSPIFYDRENKRLLHHSPWNKGALYQYKTVGSDEFKFDCNAIGEYIEMLSCGPLTEAGSYWMLMKNSQVGKLYLYKYKIEKGEFLSIAKIEITTQVAPNIYNADCFAASEHSSALLMYSVDSKVYSLSLEMLNSATTNSLEVSQVDLISRNMEITNLKFLQIEVEDDAQERPRQTMQLRLSVVDNNRSGLKAGIMFYEVSSIGGIHSEFLFEKLGFCDEVVDIDEKYN